ncbi:glycosyltransferase family 4 protein [soil metagenome]
MRVAIIAPPWVPIPPPAYGGTEAVLDGLARGLQAAGHEVLLYATGDSTCPVPRAWVFERALTVDLARPATELRHVINAYECVAGQVDIVHDHTLAGPVYAQAYSDLPVVTTNHGPFDDELGDYYRALSATVPIIAISRHQASTARDTKVAAVIHHGVDASCYPLGDGGGGFALFLGRMTATKGVHTAARAARKAGVPLKIAAKLDEAAEHAYFDQEVAPLLGDGVEFVGEIGGDDKAELIGQARCLLNPIAWAEPFGMVMIESLVSGTPVVSTGPGSVPEIIDEGVTGFIRETEDELAEALGQVADLDRARCRAAAVERFSLERMVDDHVRLFEEIIARPPRPARRA